MTKMTLKEFVAPPAAYFDDMSGYPYDEKGRACCEAKAAPYYAVFEQNRSERRRALSAMRDELAAGPVLVSTFNWGFRRLVENWVASCDRHGIDCRSFTLLFPMDEAADEFARELGFQTYFDGTSYGRLPKEACKAFGDDDFRMALFAKIAATQDMLRVGADVLRQDVDIVWLGDPRAYLRGRMARRSLDFQFMDDGPNPIYRPLHFNSGFVYIANTAASRFAWDLVFSSYARVIHYGSEQRVINIVMSYLADRGLRCERLPEMEFVNGHVIGEALGGDEKMPEASTVIHASWTPNLDEKLKRLKRLGLWYI